MQSPGVLAVSEPRAIDGADDWAAERGCRRAFAGTKRGRTVRLIRRSEVRAAKKS